MRRCKPKQTAAARYVSKERVQVKNSVKEEDEKRRTENESIADLVQCCDHMLAYFYYILYTAGVVIQSGPWEV